MLGMWQDNYVALVINNRGGPILEGNMLENMNGNHPNIVQFFK